MTAPVDPHAFVQRVMRRYPDATASRLPGVVAGEVFPLIGLLRRTQYEGRRIVGMRRERYETGFNTLGRIVDEIEDLFDD